MLQKMGPRPLLLLPLLVLEGILASGCPDGPAAPRVSDDEVLQARFLAARRTLDEVRDLKKGGKDIYADCKGLEMLLTRELRRLTAPPVRQLIDEAEKTCKGVQPAEP
jgi:hypothetical protein